MLRNDYQRSFHFLEVLVARILLFRSGNADPLFLEAHNTVQ